MKTRRYIALYIHPGMCDGFMDRKTSEYLSNEEIENLLNKADSCDKKWEEKYLALQKENVILKKKLEGKNG